MLNSQRAQTFEIQSESDLKLQDLRRKYNLLEGECRDYNKALEKKNKEIEQLTGCVDNMQVIVNKYTKNEKKDKNEVIALTQTINDLESQIEQYKHSGAADPSCYDDQLKQYKDEYQTHLHEISKEKDGLKEKCRVQQNQIEEYKGILENMNDALDKDEMDDSNRDISISQKDPNSNPLLSQNKLLNAQLSKFQIALGFDSLLDLDHNLKKLSEDLEAYEIVKTELKNLQDLVLDYQNRESEMENLIHLKNQEIKQLAFSSEEEKDKKIEELLLEKIEYETKNSELSKEINTVLKSKTSLQTQLSNIAEVLKNREKEVQILQQSRDLAETNEEQLRLEVDEIKSKLIVK